ncbi:MAG: VRR-NUC domain-containing protein [Beijerinckiaceae bacterium]
MTAPPLLQLIDGRKVRPRKAPKVKPKELSLHIAIVATLRRYAKPDWLFWHTANGEWRDIRTAAKLKAMGVRPGVPDLLLLRPDGVIHCLEFKRAGEYISEDQENFRLHCLAHGIPFVVVSTIDETLYALDKWGVLAIKLAGGAR